jgi:predicted AlkP superfamily pyrophosphatase or phosphodiesterase
MIRPLVVVDVVGLTPSLLGPHTPNINAIAKEGFQASLEQALPAVTCTAQATLLTGALPREHGIVANGWYFRDLAEVWLWRQSNHLVAGEKVWEAARRAQPGFKCAKLFWWYNMYSSAEVSVTPRPVYPADGRKLPGLYAHPASLQQHLEGLLGPFPLFNFWGPTADIRSSEWIARASAFVIEAERPDLTLVYLPHLDYDLQRLGPGDARIPAEVAAVDRAAGIVIDAARARGAEVVILSEYGIEAATGVVHINRILREMGCIAVRETLGWEMLDCGASRAFAVADHQVAHVYVNDPTAPPAVAERLRAEPGIECVLDAAGKRGLGLDHPRSGELVAIAAPGRWFAYYYWLDDARAPDFARTVDIHRKPGYDPVELFFDPDRPLLKAHAAFVLLKKMLGFRYLMDVIPLRAELVKGTHGRAPARPEEGPLLVASSRVGAAERLPMTAVKDLLLRQLGAKG